MIRQVPIETPLAPQGAVSVEGSVVPLARLAALPAPKRREALGGDEALARASERALGGEMALPGAERWRLSTASARPSSPVWVPVLERNARVVELELARDALADPWAPGRAVEVDGLALSVVGAAAHDWQDGDLVLPVRVRAGKRPRRAEYVLTEKDRRKLWKHLTGRLLAMALGSDRVRLRGDAPEAGSLWQRLGPNTALVGIPETASGRDACWPRPEDPVRSMEVREDGAFRQDQDERTALAEEHARLIWRSVLAGEKGLVASALPDTSVIAERMRGDDLAPASLWSIVGWVAGAAAVVAGGAWLLAGGEEAERDEPERA